MRSFVLASALLALLLPFAWSKSPTQPTTLTPPPGPDTLVIQQNGRPRHYRILPTPPQFLPHPLAVPLLPNLSAPPLSYPTLAPDNSPISPQNLRSLTPRIFVRLSSPSVLPSLLQLSPNSKIHRQIPYSHNAWILSAPSPESAPTTADLWRSSPGVLHAEVLLGKLWNRHSLPDDPFVDQQWHLAGSQTLPNSSAPSVGILATEAWPSATGAQITIAIVDDGLQMDHPDIAFNVDSTLAWDFADDDPDPSPLDLVTDRHGTSVAGVAAAVGQNRVGIAGVAFDARIAPLRLIADHPITDDQIADALNYETAQIHIKNNSYGRTSYDDLDYSSELVNDAIETASREGRNGRGTLFVYSAGNDGSNGDDLNYSALKTLPQVIPVAAAAAAGGPASYSTPGACLVVAAPGGEIGGAGLLTTDLIGNDGDNKDGVLLEFPDTNYTKRFIGTSGAAPIVSGVLALMLQTNPALSWRDAQEILIRSAKRTVPEDIRWASNGAGFHFHPALGAGLVQADAAVQLAASWTNLPPLEFRRFAAADLDLPIPDADSSGASHSITITNAAFRTEQILVTVDIQHAERGELEIDLIAPSGMLSRLASLREDINPDYQGWTFNTRRHWGENIDGRWTLRVRDRKNGVEGRLRGLTLEFLGASRIPIAISSRSLIKLDRIASPAPIPQPGEIVGEQFVLQNTSAQTLRSVAFSLESSHPDVAPLSPSLVIPELPPGAPISLPAPLFYRIPTHLPCGAPIPLALRIDLPNQPSPLALPFQRFLGLAEDPLSRTNSYEASESLPVPIPDMATSYAILDIPTSEPALIESVQISLRIDHSTIGDTETTLIHPDGTEVLLVNHRGGDRPNFGRGPCSAITQRLTLSDSATRPLARVAAPITGSYLPEQPLAAFRGKLAGGQWRLRIRDVYDDDSGQLRCWSLQLVTRPLVSDCTPFQSTWDPTLRLLSAPPGGALNFEADAIPGLPILLESSRTLASWQPFHTNVPTATPARFTISNPFTSPTRYFRLKR